MKTFFKSASAFFFLVFISCCCYSQNKSAYKDFDIPEKNGEAFYETIDSTVTGKSKDQLYNAARKLFARLYNNSKNVIEMDDKADGHIVTKATLLFNHKIQLGIKETSTIKFTIDFQAKDNKYRLQFSDFSQHSSTIETFQPLNKLLNQTPLYRTNFFVAYNRSITDFLETFKNAVADNLKSSDF